MLHQHFEVQPDLFPNTAPKTLDGWELMSRPPRYQILAVLRDMLDHRLLLDTTCGMPQAYPKLSPQQQRLLNRITRDAYRNARFKTKQNELTGERTYQMYGSYDMPDHEEPTTRWELFDFKVTVDRNGNEIKPHAQ